MSKEDFTSYVKLEAEVSLVGGASQTGFNTPVATVAPLTLYWFMKNNDHQIDLLAVMALLLTAFKQARHEL